MECPQPLIESGMTFIPPAIDHCFPIEQFSQQQGKQLESVKIAEFLWLRQQPKQEKLAIYVIEAKSSTPKPETQPDFDQFIDEIRTKLTNSLLLFNAMVLGRHGRAVKAALPPPFQQVDLATVDFQLILIIKGHKSDWLAPLNDKLTQELKPLIKMWSLLPTAVTVLNDDLARKKGLIE